MSETLPILGLSELFNADGTCETTTEKAVALYRAGVDLGHSLSSLSGNLGAAEKMRKLAYEFDRKANPTQKPKAAIMSDETRVLTWGEFAINSDTHAVSYQGQSTAPSQAEFNGLQYMARHPGVYISRDKLMDIMLGQGITVQDRSIDSHIKRLRQKLRKIGCPEGLINTLYGVGYAFKPDRLETKALQQTPHRLIA